MIALTASLLAFHHAPVLPSVRPAVMSTRSRPAVAQVSTEPVVGQYEGSNPTDVLASQKLYDGKKELPPVWGGIRVGTRKLVVVTGASSGLGLWTAKALAANGGYFVICAVRNVAKMDQAAKEVGIGRNDYLAMKLELGSLQSVKDFAENLKSRTWDGRTYG